MEFLSNTNSAFAEQSEPPPAALQQNKAQKRRDGRFAKLAIVRQERPGAGETIRYHY